jgi:hypothetical protein
LNVPRAQLEERELKKTKLWFQTSDTPTRPLLPKTVITVERVASNGARNPILPTPGQVSSEAARFKKAQAYI